VIHQSPRPAMRHNGARRCPKEHLNSTTRALRHLKHANFRAIDENNAHPADVRLAVHLGTSRPSLPPVLRSSACPTAVHTPQHAPCRALYRAAELNVILPSKHRPGARARDLQPAGQGGGFVRALSRNFRHATPHDAWKAQPATLEAEARATKHRPSPPRAARGPPCGGAFLPLSLPSPLSRCLSSREALKNLPLYVQSGPY
jgi:hypothetical protein